MLELVREIAAAKGYRFKAAAIYADVPKDLVRRRFAEGRIGPCGPVAPLSEADIDDAVNIVAQMGAEPFSKALDEAPDLDVIIAGRAYDPAPYAALCLRRGFDPGVAWHMGKIMECGGVCAEPKGGVILATIRADSFDLVPMTPGSRCTPLSVAAHTLYEKTRADLLAGPGGVLDLNAATYEPLGRPHRAGSRDSVFPAPGPTRSSSRAPRSWGRRTVFIGGVRDPILISQIDFLPGAGSASMPWGHHPALRSGEAQTHIPTSTERTA